MVYPGIVVNYKETPTYMVYSGIVINYRNTLTYNYCLLWHCSELQRYSNI